MLYDGNNPWDAQNALEYVRKLITQGKRFKVSIDVEKKPTEPQMSYLHLIIRYWASQYGCSEEEAKLDFFKRTCNLQLFDTGECRRDGSHILRSTRDLDSAEMSLAIERFRNWSASVCGIYLPSPDDRDAQFYARQETAKCEAFL